MPCMAIALLSRTDGSGTSAIGTTVGHQIFMRHNLIDEANAQCLCSVEMVPDHGAATPAIGGSGESSARWSFLDARQALTNYRVSIVEAVLVASHEIELLKDSVTEMAPLTRDDARSMIGRFKGTGILIGARGRPAGDIEALIEFAHYGRFQALDLNPVIVRPTGQGVVAVDISVETVDAA